MERSSDGIASLNSSISSVSVRDAAANSLPPATTTTHIYSADPNLSPLHPLSHPPVQHVSSVMESENSTVAEDRSRRATSVLSMDDLEAAQALEGLRTDFGASPRASQQTTASPDSRAQQEPILQLLTSSHPLISSAINGSVAAYTSSKTYSPRWKSSAEFIERNIGSPVASTVGTVGRKTGVEGSLRWALQRHTSNSSESGRSKRRKIGSGKPADRDLEIGLSTNMAPGNMPETPDLYLNESLPPYDDQKSPSYDDVGRERSRSPRQSTWQSRLMISTSGLGVSMSEESMKSLGYCLTWLAWANGRLGKSIVALKQTLEDWDSLQSKTEAQAPNQTMLSQRIQALKQDVLTTLKQVVDVVSKYAGGALPENARHLVRRHLTSLPQRFRLASTACPAPESSGTSSETFSSGRRILVLAQEGLEILAQVSGVVDETLVSAQHWCERLGRRRSGNNATEKNGEAAAQPSVQPAAQEYPSDFKQPIIDAPKDTPMPDLEKA